jgi:hypothetical protein
MKLSPQYSPKGRSNYKYILPTLQEDTNRSLTVKQVFLLEINKPFRTRNSSEPLQII